MGIFSRKGAAKERAPLTRSEPPNVQVAQAIRQSSSTAVAASWHDVFDAITGQVNHMLGSRDPDRSVDLDGYHIYGGSGVVRVNPMHWTRLYQLYEALRDYYQPLGYKVDVRLSVSATVSGYRERSIETPDPLTAESIKWLCERSSVNMRVIVSAP